MWICVVPGGTTAATKTWSRDRTFVHRHKDRRKSFRPNKMKWPRTKFNDTATARLSLLLPSNHSSISGIRRNIAVSRCPQDLPFLLEGMCMKENRSHSRRHSSYTTGWGRVTATFGERCSSCMVYVCRLSFPARTKSIGCKFLFLTKPEKLSSFKQSSCKKL